MIALAYFSTAAAVMNEDGLREIVIRSRQNNVGKGVTGMLCHYEGSFLQFLEGEDAAVTEIFTAISSDARHNSILEVYRAPITERVFGDWTMAMVKPDQIGPEHQAFTKALRQVELVGNAKHRRSLEPFLDAFRAWVR